MAEKTTHFGRAGEFFAMSELLLRGWNVAVPVVDVGDDVFVVDDNDKTTYRLQVKSAKKNATGTYTFNLSRRQLRELAQIELIYMLLIRDADRWHFLVIPRDELVALRDSFQLPAGTRPRGAPPKNDEDAKTDVLALTVSFDGVTVRGWDADLRGFLNRWPHVLPEIGSGPGTRHGQEGSA